MLTLALIALLAGPGISPEALDSILRAQATQASGTAYEVTWRSSSSPRPCRLVAVPPDRLHLFDGGDEHVIVGDRAWMRIGGGAWQEELSPDTVRHFHGPRRADDWAAELRAASALAPRRLGGVDAPGYQYTLAWPDGSEEVRLWVDPRDGRPLRYEQDLPDGQTSWDLRYDAGLSVAPPPGQPQPGSAARPFISPRVTLALSQAGRYDFAAVARPWPGAIVRGTGAVQVGDRSPAGPADLEEALRALLRRGGGEAQRLRLFVDRDAPWATVEALLDAARAAGAGGVDLGARSDSGREVSLAVAVRGPSTPAPGRPGLLPLLARAGTGSGAAQRFVLNASETPRGPFEERLRDILSVRRDPAVDVQAEGRQRWQDVLAVVDAVVLAGGEPILTTTSARRFLPEPPPPPPPPPPPR